MEHIDIIAIGSGPANLALLTAILDQYDPEAQSKNVAFLERSKEFRWQHQRAGFGRLQVPYLKDLATQRNPRSRFTFLNFLHEHGRLEAFINLRDPRPSLDEIGAYLSWISQIGRPILRFDCDVRRIDAILDGNGKVERVKLEVHNAEGKASQYTARTVILGCGRSPNIPLNIASSLVSRVLHTASASVQNLERLLLSSANQPIVIVGSGQSAIETALCLLDRGAQRLEIYLRGAAMRAIDDNPFVNHWYQTAGGRDFQELTFDAKRTLLSELAGTNRGVVERELLDDLFRKKYDGMRIGIDRICFHAYHSLEDISHVGGEICCTFRDLQTGDTVEQIAGGVVLATGYKGPDLSLASGLLPWFETGDDGMPLICPTRMIKSRPDFRPRVFVNGQLDEVFGPADSTFSTLAQRGGSLFRDVFGETR